MAKQNKYSYYRVIQQYYTGSYGWEDVSEYECSSTGKTFEKSGEFITLRYGRKRELTLLEIDLKEYRTLGYPTRVITRKVLNPTK